MKIIRLNRANRDLLDKFLAIAGDSLKTFRYFAKRDIEALKSHVVTLLGIEDEMLPLNWMVPVAYGHLDKDGDDIWLGICVAWERRGMGFGSDILTALLKYADNAKIDKIRLTVDESNVPARKLYEKNGFIVEKTVDDTVYYRRNIK
jgi:GNAT superfamily N-acetyltransferase